MPFSYPDPALLKLDVLGASGPDKEKIRWQNTAKWLRLSTKANLDPCDGLRVPMGSDDQELSLTFSPTK